MSDFYGLCRLFSEKHREVHEICSHCNTSHSKELLCHGARESLDIRKSCDFCGSRHSNLNNHFAEHMLAHLHECLDKIDKSNQRHICEEKAKNMVVKKDHRICILCVAKLFSNNEIRHEDLDDVECIEFLHQTRTCPHFCFYCFIDGYQYSVDDLREHRWYECPLPEETKYCIDDGF